ncbi:MAG: homoserine kinase [Planctomycetota bacterium]
MDPRLVVRVSASTSNLGPGFDFLGLCLGLHLRAVAEVRADAHEHGVELNGTATTWRPEDDLMLAALRAYERRAERALPPLALTVDSEIPVGRGFGSSGAAVAAALLLAAAADERAGHAALDRATLVEVALEVEGHPDNGTASLVGGCTLSVPRPGGVTVVRQPVHASLGFALAWPEDPLFTDAARSALPAEVPFADAVENPRRLALLLEGLRTGAPDLLALGVEDRLHERFRRALISGSDDACRAARDAGAFAACLSGAGSGLVAIGPIGGMDPIAEALAAPLDGGMGRAVAFAPDAPSVQAEERASERD